MVGFPNIMNIYSKPSCDIIIICFPDKTIFIMLSGPEVFFTNFPEVLTKNKAHQVRSFIRMEPRKK